MLTRMIALMVSVFLCAALLVAQVPSQGPLPGTGKPDGGGKPENHPTPDPPKAKPETPPGKTQVTPPPPPVTIPPPPAVNPPPATELPPSVTPMPTAETVEGLIGATRPATYAQRSILGFDGAFIGRVSIATMSVIVDVLNEPEATPDHAARMKFAGRIMREQEIATRQIARLVVSAIPVMSDARGYTATPVTDAQLRAWLAQRWTAMAHSMGNPF